jgi:hypothetical protein
LKYIGEGSKTDEKRGKKERKKEKKHSLSQNSIYSDNTCRSVMEMML